MIVVGGQHRLGLDHLPAHSHRPEHRCGRPHCTREAMKCVGDQPNAKRSTILWTATRMLRKDSRCAPPWPVKRSRRPERATRCHPRSGPCVARLSRRKAVCRVAALKGGQQIPPRLNTSGQRQPQRPFRRAWSLTTACSASSSVSIPRLACSYSLVPAVGQFLCRRVRPPASQLHLSLPVPGPGYDGSALEVVPRRAAPPKAAVWTTATTCGGIQIHAGSLSYPVGGLSSVPFFIFGWAYVACGRTPHHLESPMRRQHSILGAVSVVVASTVASAQTAAFICRARHHRELQPRPDRRKFRRVVRNGGFGKFRHGANLLLPSSKHRPST